MFRRRSQPAAAEALESLPASARGPKTPLLQVQRLTKYFLRRRSWLEEPEIVRAVDGVSLHLRAAETLGLVGESGSGKTTLIHALLRLQEPDYGRVEFAGVDVLELSAREMAKLRRRFQVLLQAPTTALPAERTALWAVEQGLRVHGMLGRGDERRERARFWLERVGLRRELGSRPFYQLSAGERQRVLLARTLALEPAFIACDEPLGLLDPASQAELLSLLVETQQERQTALLYASRDLQAVARMSQRVAVMYRGVLVESGPATSVFTRPRHPYTQALLKTHDASSRHLPVLPLTAAESRGRPQTGCPFQPSCPRAGPGCDTDMPGWVELDLQHHRVACWFPDN